MSDILDSGERRTFETGAERDMQEGKGRFDLLPMCVLMRLAKHYEKGAIKYKERNWEKGIPAHSFADSAMRHLVKYLDGWIDEDHLIAAIWNLMGLAWTEEKKPDLIDIPARKNPYYMSESKTFSTAGNEKWVQEPVTYEKLLPPGTNTAKLFEEIYKQAQKYKPTKETETHSYCQDCAEIGTSECKLCNNGDRHSNMK